MKMKCGLALILFAVAGGSYAQTQSGLAPQTDDPLQAAVQAAATAFGRCVIDATAAVPNDVPAEAGAAQVLDGCNGQKQALLQSVEAMIATLPEAQRAEARERIQSRMASELEAMSAEIAEEIRQRRAAAPVDPVQP